MNHLAKQQHALAGIFFQGSVADFNGIFYAVAETKVTGDEKSDRSEIEYGRRKVLLAQILYPSYVFYFSGDV